MFYKLFLLTVIFFKLSGTDILVYSYDRPMQLHLFLESLYENVTGFENVYIVYRSSSNDFEQGYEICFGLIKPKFSKLFLIKEVNGQFKKLTLNFFELFKESKYMVFGLDDIIITSKIDLKQCVSYLENYSSCYGFYFRLGGNINYCYSLNKSVGVPNLVNLADDIKMFNFGEKGGDWDYPCTLDFCLYKKNIIYKEIKNLKFFNPNSLEASWHASEYSKLKNKKGLICNYSKIVNTPWNIVQDTHNNRTQGLDKNYFLDKFKSGFVFDLYKYQNLIYNSPHVELDLFFKKL